MLIQCPACNAQAKLPDNKEGAKVRCSECERVYVARPFGSRGPKKKEDPTKYFIIGGAVLLFAGIMIVTRGSSDNTPVAAEPEEEVVEESLPTGWDSPFVKVGRELHEAIFTQNEGKLITGLHPKRVYDRVHAAPEDPPEDWAPAATWIEVPKGDQVVFMQGIRDELLKGDDFELVGQWKPFDGGVSDESDEDVKIRLRVQHRDASLGLPDRHVEWHLARDGSRWKAYDWFRWISPEEIEKERRARKKKTTKRTLSDGSLVIEGVVRPIPWEDDTPEELRTEVNGLITKMIDLEIPGPEANRARMRVVEIGIPAIPALLSKMAEIPIDTEDQAIQVNLVHMCMSEITGYQTTFKVHELMGTTRERQESGLKQWFGWYDRKWKKFKGSGGREEGDDPLWDDPDFKPRNEKERREFERLRHEREQNQSGG
ncbi:MAG: hypothetical protein GY711_28290 [bacterium]|nr:hypothetical protein [bacterium]